MHILNANQMAGMIPIPGGVFWIYFTGIAMLLAVISIYTKFLGEIAMLLMALMLLIFIITIHIPGLGNPQSAQFALTNLLKDSGLLGGALLLAGIFRKEKKEAQV